MAASEFRALGVDEIVICKSQIQIPRDNDDDVIILKPNTGTFDEITSAAFTSGYTTNFASIFHIPPGYIIKKVLLKHVTGGNSTNLAAIGSLNCKAFYFANGSDSHGQTINFNSDAISSSSEPVTTFQSFEFDFDDSSRSTSNSSIILAFYPTTSVNNWSNTSSGNYTLIYTLIASRD